MRSTRELREDTGRSAVRAWSAVRRFAVTFSQGKGLRAGPGAGALWQFSGVRMPDGDEEARNIEPFTGIGFYSRPSASGAPEAIAAMLGDANSPVVVALRDEKTRQGSASDLSPDETAIYNTLARAHVKADGTIELKTIAGVAEKMVKGETYRSAEDTMLSAVQELATAVGALAAGLLTLHAVGPPAGPYPDTVSLTPTIVAATALATAATAAATAVATFQAAAPTYLARVGRVE